ncbi:MAG: acetyl-CoA carboxylase biotin carboxyl carrier protein [Planctomycetaceae bacterium]|nr:acetyl-CoA carboxylase biotin carboxyl carrier protein [Planctomycetaceae bacterium]
MSDSDTGPDDVFDVDRIRRLVELMEQHDLREVDLRQAEQRIRLCRGAEMVYASPVAPPALATPSSPPASAAPAAAAPAPPPAEVVEEHMVIVRSPMVGTFYARPNPNADPFVKIGDMVAPETTVCIIEAMKVFNEIPAETRGKIVAVLVDDEEPVDHGRPLFKIDTRAS